MIGEKFDNQISNHNIDNILQHITNYNGCYAKDQIHNLKNGFYVFNLEDIEEDGSHWTMLYKDDNNIIYIDSFGIILPDTILKLCKNHQIKYSSHHIQNIKSLNCGFYSIYFILQINHGIDILNILLKFSNDGSIKNDKILFNELQEYI